MQRFEISGVHTKLDNHLKKYVDRKLGGLDRYLSRHVKASAHAEVMLKEGKSKNKNDFTCEMTLFVPHETLNVKESTVNMYAAIDIVEEKMKQQLKKYKSLHGNPRLHRRLVSRLRGRMA